VAVTKHNSTAVVSEADFLLTYDASLYDRFSVAVDVVLLSAHERRLHTVLLKREEHPHKGRFALPGGFVGAQEELGRAAARVCQAKAGIADVFLEQLYTFGEPHRDPRLRVVSVAYYALIPYARFAALARTGRGITVATLQVPWKGEAGGPVSASEGKNPSLPLAFDHASILGLVIKRLRGKLSYTPIAFALLDEAFTLFDLQRVHEAILGRTVNKDSFRRRILAGGCVRPSGKRQAGVVHRPAELYTLHPQVRRAVTAGQRTMLRP
jgi:8-oxo-dGTP diphosphatase